MGEFEPTEFTDEASKPKQRPLSQIPEGPGNEGLVLVEIIYRLPRNNGPAAKPEPIWMLAEGAFTLREVAGGTEVPGTLTIQFTDSRGNKYEASVETEGRPWSGF